MGFSLLFIASINLLDTLFISNFVLNIRSYGFYFFFFSSFDDILLLVVSLRRKLLLKFHI